MPKAKSNLKTKKTETVKTKAHTTKVSTKAVRKTREAQPGLSAEVYNISGKKEGTTALPKEIFGQKPNKILLSQAIHVYSTNQTAHFGSTKTRAEVRGGGRKPWRQKGTGRARAGSIRSPLWVGGAKALGPKSRKTTLLLPKKMKTNALISALSDKASNGEVKVISNIEKIDPKTKIISNFISKVQTSGSHLFIISKPINNVLLATRNIKKVSSQRAIDLNAYELIKNRNIFFSAEALDILNSRLTKKGGN